MSPRTSRSAEWPTLWLILACYALWGLGTTVVAAAWLPGAIVLTGFTVALFSSLQHEILHGHPFRNATLNMALVFPGLTVFIPYLRFRDTHLDHHHDEILTDPYDDPESNYLDPKVWHRLPRPVRWLLMFNNTLLGRFLIGSLISQAAFMYWDARAALAGDGRVIRGWLWHIPSLALVFWWLVSVAMMPVWAYLIAAYIGVSLIKIRTFLEHRAHEDDTCRTAIVEGRGLLAFLFLNNNLHVVHHAHPGVPWYALPKLYSANKDQYLARNDSYVYRSYGEVFRRFLLRRKDPVPHPFWH